MPIFAQILHIETFELTQQYTCIVICNQMPRPTVRGPHPTPQQFLRIRYLYSSWMGHWFNVDNGNTFHPQFIDGMQFASVILRDLAGYTWAWYMHDLDEPHVSDEWVWFIQGLNAAFFWPDGAPIGIPLPA